MNFIKIRYEINNKIIMEKIENKLPTLHSRNNIGLSKSPSNFMKPSKTNLPDIFRSKVRYKDLIILDAKEKKVTIGYGITSLLGILPNKKDEQYLQILQSKPNGLYTGKDKFDLPRVANNDRTNISTGVKFFMRKRSPQGAGNRSHKESDDFMQTLGILPILVKFCRYNADNISSKEKNENKIAFKYELYFTVSI